MAELLVSVRSASEAMLALSGGAHLIDVKEPDRGPLGRADDVVLLAVTQAVRGRVPVSAALGELRERQSPPPDCGLSFAKFGLAGCGRLSRWQQLFREVGSALPSTCRAVAVAYADWTIAEAPPPEEVCSVACEYKTAFLIDTWHKSGPRLTDLLPRDAIKRLCARCHRAGIEVALAGSLGPAQIAELYEAKPTWFAVRGAACRKGRRRAAVDSEAVGRLVAIACRGVRANDTQTRWE